ncbi:hypothetical protein PRIP_03993 [Listeria riparia FSL S10-1204]|uniref:Uncharacterized protein n=1 Tax=Listeria riparia FSL S10-1204 TaxID=1265816 RepID=W7D2H5_9LIST|nr:hypothetical protein PRIP_03993 [Listeria riparia FSL S10-1204]
MEDWTESFFSGDACLFAGFGFSEDKATVMFLLVTSFPSWVARLIWCLASRASSSKTSQPPIKSKSGFLLRLLQFLSELGEPVRFFGLVQPHMPTPRKLRALRKNQKRIFTAAAPVFVGANGRVRLFGLSSKNSLQVFRLRGCNWGLFMINYCSV